MPDKRSQIRRYLITSFSILSCVLFYSVVFGDNLTTMPDGSPRKQIQAIKVNGEKISMDGRLDESIWKSASYVSDFIQRDPNQGANPESKTEVAVAYDDEAIYIAGRMFAVEPDKLFMHLDRRDNQGSLAEQFIVSIDSYCDRRTCYGFGVNAAGVRIDRYLGADDEFNRDYRYDPVWDARTARTEFGWTVEMKIPFSQLRFHDNPEQTWGIQFNRYVPSRNEDNFWILVPRGEQGWASRFGNLTGITGVKPARRLELTPYVASDGRFSSLPYRTDLPKGFFDGSEMRGRIGADIKIGLGPNMTLDATFNPDFGQVEADPAEVNLSAFETFFSERRPFFTEGIGLISNFGGQFYTRRIGGRPRGFAVYDDPVVDSNQTFSTTEDFPDGSTILGAGKMSGSFWNGGTIAAIVALTARENSTIFEQIDNVDTAGNIIGRASSREFDVEVDPMTLYAASVMRKPYGSRGSTATFGAFGMHRFMDEDSPLRDQLRSTAFNVLSATEYRLPGNRFVFYTQHVMTHVRGKNTVITRTQRDSRHYFGRPDQDYLRVDSNRTHMTGFQHYAEIYTRNAKHWFPFANISFESPDLERNDMGQLGNTDDIDASLDLNYEEQDPGKLFRNFNMNVGYSGNWSYGGIRGFSDLAVNFNARLLNYWSFGTRIAKQFTWFDDQSTRGGITVANLPGYSTRYYIESPFSRGVRYGISVNYGIDDLDGYLTIFSPYLNARIGNRVYLSVEPQFIRQRQPFQFAGSISDPTATYAQLDGRRYFFSQFRNEEMRISVRANYYFNPRLSLELYAEPFVTTATFSDFEELTAAGTNNTKEFDSVVEGEDSYTATRGSETVEIPKRGFNSSFDFRSFRSNLVLRWEFSPGSTMFLVWQRNLSNDDPLTRSSRISSRSIIESIGDEGDDIVALKIAYWIPLG